MFNPNLRMPLRLSIGLGLAALSVLAIDTSDGLANPVAKPGSPVLSAASQAQPRVELKLSADRQQVQREANGQTKTTWQALGNPGQNAKVGSGDVIRFTLNGLNQGKGAAKHLLLNQAIPAGTRYVLQSARLINAPADVQFSIDGGKSYSPSPKVKVQRGNQLIEEPAPAEAYTHIRLGLNQELSPQGTVRGEYQVTVK
jgi:uncharacterized repeat protein (TIGR01451 family)